MAPPGGCPTILEVREWNCAVLINVDLWSHTGGNAGFAGAAGQVWLVSRDWVILVNDGHPGDLPNRALHASWGRAEKSHLAAPERDRKG